MGVASRPKAVAVWMEMWLPLVLDDLGQRLLDKSIRYRGNAEESGATVWLWDFYAPYRLGAITTLHQLCADGRPVRFQMWASSSSTVMPSMPGAPLLRLTCAKARLRFSLSSTSVIRVETPGDAVVWGFPAMGSSTGVAALGNGGGTQGHSPSRLSDALPSLFTPSSFTFKVQAFGAGRTYYAFC